jgi:low affinity Fe/Cu permease
MIATMSRTPATPPSGSSGERFHHFARWAADRVGSAWAFVVALAIVLVWGFLGPIYGFSDTWQLVINTGTTIVTFLIVFLIQNSQNRETRAIRLKLDELLRAIKGARNQLIELDEMTDAELDVLEKEFRLIRETTSGDPGAGSTVLEGVRRGRRRRGDDTPEEGKPVDQPCGVKKTRK